jgi:nucleotide-binding universal stress UspA family protein
LEMIRTILVPVDGSSFSEQAIPVALGVAHRTGAAIELVMAFDTYADAGVGALGIAAPPTYLISDDARLEEVRGERESYLAALSQRLRAESGRHVRSEILEGRTVEVLAERARRRADLVVMSTHARGGLRRLWLGSVADCLIREVSVPVLLVKPTQSADSTGPDGLHHFRHVLVPLDGSRFAEAVLEPMLDLLGNNLGPVICSLLQVQSPLHAASFPPTTELHATGAAGDYLDDVTERLTRRGLHVEHRTVVNEQTSQAILEVAGKVTADLIALATHGHGGLRRYLIGSVADEVLRGAETTVLVHRPVA